ncbi:hypothetical protein HELRODRAFT_193024 [Helobdella robusta]|uniref:Uncharacterized protein n=1 Tax=Helobdella robusta TaxID=6412 RepID=T1FUJ2_HELRO|nr:hypothetical protein HELRODRAFT_193024 [Helobdella robusta]ESN98268.1 hypothetical protein HELRODRAFT_193024 [Helobdella robusta]
MNKNINNNMNKNINNNINNNPRNDKIMNANSNNKNIAKSEIKNVNDNSNNNNNNTSTATTTEDKIKTDNSTQTDPNIFCGFHNHRIKRLVDEILYAYLYPVRKYDPVKCGYLCRSLCKMIRDRSQEITKAYDWLDGKETLPLKLVINVVIGQDLNQNFQMACRTWSDVNKDGFVCCVYRNNVIFAVATVHGMDNNTCYCHGDDPQAQQQQPHQQYNSSSSNNVFSEANEFKNHAQLSGGSWGWDTAFSPPVVNEILIKQKGLFNPELQITLIHSVFHLNKAYKYTVKLFFKLTKSQSKQYYVNVSSKVTHP